MSASTWPPWNVTSLRSNLHDLQTLIEATQAEKGNEEILGWLARLLVVRTSGYVEQSVFEIVRGFTAKRSGGMVRSFAHSWQERSINPAPEALCALVGRFDAGLQEELEAWLDADDQRYRRELSFMVNRRNRIAHGLNEGIGPKRALELVEAAQEVTDWFILRFNPDS